MPRLSRSSSSSFVDFIRVPIWFYKTIGEELYAHRSTNQLRSALYRLLFYVGFVNFNLLVAGEIIYFVGALRSMATVLQATAVAPCIGFSFVADFKQIALAVHKKTLRVLLDELEASFPTNAVDQREYKLPHYERIMKRVMIIFTVLCLAYTSTFSLYPACRSAVLYYLLGAPKFERNLGFFIWYPYDATGGSSLVYWATYLSQVHAAYLAGVAFLSADLLLVASITQLCMHFDHISKELSEFVGGDKAEDNMQFLQRVVQHHAKCLELSEHVNEIFSFSLLLNFLTASLTICFIGFQVTASSIEDIIKYCIFLLASMVQVFIVCYYGDELRSASLRVGEAAYNHSWFDCDVKYKRMLVFIIARSQKPASIRAPTFPPISLETYMKVLSMSYQFFALLRTTYYGD